MLFHLTVFMCASTLMPLTLPPLIFLTATLAPVLTLVLVCDIVLSRPHLLSEMVIKKVELEPIPNFSILSVSSMSKQSLALPTVSAMNFLLHCSSLGPCS